MNLQPLFSEPILHQHRFQDVHPGQASDVWLVKTAREEVVVRSSRLSGEVDEDFWSGARLLFGVVPGDTDGLMVAHETLRALCTIPIPRVLRRGVAQEREFLVVEKLSGFTLRSFPNLSGGACEHLGEAIAKIHSAFSNTCGNMSGTYRYASVEFPMRMAEVIEAIVLRYHRNDPSMLACLPEMLDLARKSPQPEHASPIMLDMDPTQFLFDRNHITGLVDLEVYVYGPRELDLVALEYLLSKQAAIAFQRGYSRILPFPCLEKVRTVYRYLNRALSVQGGVPIHQWMNAPTCFEDTTS